ncbi:Vvs1 protein [Martiniozyma asiatica (nom. inval.)]|nr:Vvs1 protein [Martiniozyma asiatica]
MRSQSSDPLLGAKIQTEWTSTLVISVSIACITSVLYGYHMAELNAPSEYIKSSLSLSDSQLGFATAIFSIGGLFASTAASSVSQSKGLTWSFSATCALYALGSFIEACAPSFIVIVIGRFISGLAGGFAIVFVPLYVNAVSPISLRGLLGSMTQVSVNLGILITQLVALVFDGDRWRIIIHFGWIIALIGLIGVYYMEESPKWLFQKGDELEAGRALKKFRTGETVFEEINSWIEEKKLHDQLLERKPHLKNLGFKEYLQDDSYSNSRKIATFSMLGQQFAGINSVIFYGVPLLAGLFPNISVLLNCMLSTLNMCLTLISSLLIDKLGRKPLLITSLSIMCLSCILLTVGTLAHSSSITLTAAISYISSFAIGCGPIPFLLISEVSQTEVKHIAQSWATDCNWASVFIIGALFPVVNDYFTGWIWLFFAFTCATFASWVYYFIPESMGKHGYNDVWGIRGD